MITNPKIICDLFSFLDKDQIERIQLVNQFCNNIIICHQNILPLREFYELVFHQYQIRLYATKEDWSNRLVSYIIEFDGTNFSKIEEHEWCGLSSQYSQLTVDEVLTNLNNVVYETIQLGDINSEDRLNYLLNMMKLVTRETGGRFRGKFGRCREGRFDSKLAEMFNNYIIVDDLDLIYIVDNRDDDSYIREVCANPEIVQLPSTPKEIRLELLRFKDNDKVLNFIPNVELNGANRLTIEFLTSETNYGNFIRQWFKLYHKHENPISLVGKFETWHHFEIILDDLKTFLNNTQLRVKYRLEEFHRTFRGVTYQYLKRCCVLHETDSYALVVEMVYRGVTDTSSINASDLDQPPCNKMQKISFCVKSL